MINIISIIISFVIKNKKLMIIVGIAIAVLLIFFGAFNLFLKIQNVARIEEHNKELTQANLQLYNSFTKLQRHQQETNIIKNNLFEKTIQQEKIIAKQKFYLKDLIGIIHAFKKNKPYKVNDAVNSTFSDILSELRTSTDQTYTFETRTNPAPSPSKGTTN